MKNAIIIHGMRDKDKYFSDEYPSLSNSHWLPWLQKQLLMKNILTQTPEMPDAYIPDYQKWRREFERYDVNEETILIGHSCGAGFLLRWLSENKVKIYKLFLVAPWLDPKNKKTASFFDFEIDSLLPSRVNEVHLFISKNDNEDILQSDEMIKERLADIIRHEFPDKGHFTYNDMKTEKFPELLDSIC